jgi:hypothetical protein
MTPQQIAATQRIGLMVLETIEEQGEQGAPSGPMYAAMNAHGCTLSQYQSLMGTLLGRDFVSMPEPDVYAITDGGRQFIKKLRAALPSA